MGSSRTADLAPACRVEQSGSRNGPAAPGEWIARLDVPLDFVANALGEPVTPRDWRILLMRHRPGRSGEPEESSVLPITQSVTPYCPAATAVSR
jgi:hypothetical protein